LPALLAPVPAPGVNASIDRLWYARTKTVIDPLNHFRYIDLALASRRLCSIVIRYRRARRQTLPAGRVVRSGSVKTASETSEILKG
jgi:hypothetical protein